MRILAIRSGFAVPLLIKNKTGLGMTVPDENFTITDVRNAVGARRMLEVMDCNTQHNFEMSMKEVRALAKSSLLNI